MTWIVVDDVSAFIPGGPFALASTPCGRADAVDRILERFFSPAALRERERASWARITGMDWGVPEFDWASQARAGHPVPTPRVGEFGFRDPERARQLDELVNAAAALYRVQNDLRARAALRDRFIREMRAAHSELREPTRTRPTVRPQHRGSA